MQGTSDLMVLGERLKTETGARAHSGDDRNCPRKIGKAKKPCHLATLPTFEERMLSPMPQSRRYLQGLRQFHHLLPLQALRHIALEQKSFMAACVCHEGEGSSVASLTASHPVNRKLVSAER